MRQTIANRWADALRSNKYRQIRGSYKDGLGGYCPLQVLRELAPHTGANPKTVRVWAGMKTVDAQIPSLKKGVIDLNDHDKKSFREIAAIIELHAKEI